MREAATQLGKETSGEKPLFDDLPPLPEDDEELPSFFDEQITPRMQTAQVAAELDRHKERLLSDGGTAYRRRAAKAHALLGCRL